MAPEIGDAELLRLAASAERSSEHPLGRAVVAAAAERGLALSEVQGFRSLPGYGIEAGINGSSLIVGKPAALLLLRKGMPGNSTVTICHSRTRDLATVTREADVLIAAIGAPEFVTGDMVKPGAAVIDVGINRVADATKKRGYRLVGDVAFEEVAEKASRITPVPGGVGPMTVAMLMRNTVKACRLFRQARS